MSLLRRLGTLGAALTMGAVAMLANAAPAQAADAYPCGPQWWHSGQGLYVQTCPDWSPNNWIPVYEYNDANSRQVGQIYAPGDDWYVCDYPGASLTRYGLTNNWWALTVADNGAAGWVNEIYFRGGGTNEPDATLRVCPFFASGKTLLGASAR
ncbi:hypothetical protein [Phytohabitans rumicis]|uniref:Secreted protein n=1 Tax=Phytohabitans rumicis TaxID=1076125 RepID=A0A6V8LQN4_9ACTN|nr:hypothetical protein [Phytohabitans rumicis]GFJ96417.1 hypothetical protein Prum_100590 [Phytohabitans rumicis]